METQDLTEAIKLKSIKQLLQESWQIYRSKIKTLLGIMAVLVGFNIFNEVLTIFINTFKGEPYLFVIIFPLVFILAYIFPLVSVFLNFLISPSLIFAIKEDIGIKEAYKKGFKILVSYLWVSILLAVIILGGFVFFIIPGILFLIWFSLAGFILIDEDKKGMDAILRSKFLVSGNFWEVLQRFLVVFVFVIITYFLSSFIIRESIISGLLFKIANSLILLFISPFVIIYEFLIYKNLKEIKAKIPYKKPSIL